MNCGLDLTPSLSPGEREPAIRSRILSLIVLSALFTLQVQAEVTLPRVIDSNMVLQRGQPVPIWGWAEPGEEVRVEFGGQSKRTQADRTRRWEVRLRPLKASGRPADLVVTGVNRIVLTNILVGEVWLCSGQSNMEKPIGAQQGQRPQRDLKSRGWFLCNSNAHEALKFSAVAYFFGCDIHRELGVPVGLTESAWGGTRIEPWTPAVGFDTVPALRGKIELPDPHATLNQRVPTVLYNAMIAPLVPFAFRGALWYQGESNLIDVPDGPIYADKMRALIEGWRQVWGMGKFSFYYVQLAPFTYFSDREKPRADSPERLPEMWEAQTDALKVPKTGMVVTTDLVQDVHDLHPVNKQDVGRRLARLALAKDYGRKDMVWSGPMLRKATFKNGRAILYFDHVDGGLVSKDGKPLSWFTIAGEDGGFVAANAVIEDDTVVVSSPEVTKPKVVRFAWHEKAMPNLFNAAGLPAVPFRTDHYAIPSAVPENAQDTYFSDWPAGADPAEVGRRVAQKFVLRPFRYQTNAAKADLGVIYPEACAWYGSLTVAQLIGDKTLSQALIQKFDALLDEEGGKHVNRSAHVDYRVFGIVPLEIYIETKDARCLELGRELADAQWETLTDDGLTTEARYWGDDIYMISALQTQAYRSTGDPKYLDRAARLTVAYVDKLQQPNGLFFHAADSPFCWGRGCGWYAAGTTELLSELPADHPQRARILASYKELMAGLLKYQTDSGLWRQLVDRPEAWPETSGSAMFAYAMITGVKRGWLEGDVYGPAARKAWLALAGELDGEANLRNVCVGTDKAFKEVGADPEKQLQFYLDRPRETGDLHGQAAMLWAAGALLE